MSKVSKRAPNNEMKGTLLGKMTSGIIAGLMSLKTIKAKLSFTESTENLLDV